jgi:hypothetical protein
VRVTDWAGEGETRKNQCFFPCRMSEKDRSDYYVQRMNDTREITQDSEYNVDAEVSAATTLEEDSQRRQDDGEDDLADVAVDFSR